ncbi:Zinc finger protein ZIC 1 [Mortierella antarctica]|nr:Zinc finger protein ZIC 1 [Mortierella antarctica]
MKDIRDSRDASGNTAQEVTSITDLQTMMGRFWEAHSRQFREIEGSLTEQLSTLIKKNGFLCQKIDALQRVNTDLEYKFSVTNSELERARREFSELHAKYELKNANYIDLKAVCYQLDAQLNKVNGTTSDECIISRIEHGSDRKKRRLSVDISEDEYESGYPPFEKTPGSMIVPAAIRTSVSVPSKSVDSPPSAGITQSTWTCLWKSCNQVFGALDWLVSHVEEAHIGLGKSHYTCEWENCIVKQKPFHKHHQIIRHMRTHTGEKPFECTYGGCGKKFARSDSLLEHSRKHSGTSVDFHKMMEFSTQREQDAKHVDGLMLQLDTIQEHQQATCFRHDSASLQTTGGSTDDQRDPVGYYASPPDTRSSPEKESRQGSNPLASHQGDMDIETSGVLGDDQRQKTNHHSMGHVQHHHRQQQDLYCQHLPYHSSSQYIQGRGPSMEERSMQKKRGHANTASLGLSRMEIRDDYGHSHTSSSLEYPPRDMYQGKGHGHSHTPSLEMPPIPGQMHRIDDRRQFPIQDRQLMHHSHYSQTETKSQSHNVCLPQVKEPSLANYSAESQSLQLQPDDHGQRLEGITVEPVAQEEKAHAHTNVIESSTQESQEYVDSPASNPTPRSPPMTNKDEPTTETFYRASSPGKSAMKDDAKTAVAVI